MIRVEVEGQEAHVGLSDACLLSLDSFSCNSRTVQPSVCGNTLFNSLSLATQLVSEFVVH